MAKKPKQNLQAGSTDKVEDPIPRRPKYKLLDGVAVPESFFCPLSEVLMKDPVLVSSGQTYERSTVEEWQKSGNMICVVTGETLNKDVAPNHLIRALIRNWCNEHNQSDLICYNLYTPLCIRQDYFVSLYKKLSSETPAEQKAAAKELRQQTTKLPYFRGLYAESPDAVPNLIAVLSRSVGISEIYPQLQEDLITTLMIISDDVKVKKAIVESSNGISVIIQALESDNIETQRNAVLTIFRISCMDSNKEIVGKTGAMLNLVNLLMGSRRKLLFKDVTKSLFRLFLDNENKVKAVKTFADAGIFEKIEDSECVDTMLPIFASLSNLEEGINEMEKYNCRPMFHVMRRGHYGQEMEYGIAILHFALQKDISEWNKLIMKEEITYGTISDISRRGSLNARKVAKAILDKLKPVRQPEPFSDYAFLPTLYAL